MSDNYQAVYDAVRSRIGGVNLDYVFEMILQQAFGNAGHHIQCAQEQIAACLTEPSVVYRPALSVDGNQWCALYGNDLQSGVAGFGASPAEAMSDFNKNWHVAINAKGDAS